MHIAYCKDCKKIVYTYFTATNSIVSSQPHIKDQCLKCYAKAHQMEIKKIKQQAFQLAPVPKEEKKTEEK